MDAGEWFDWVDQYFAKAFFLNHTFKFCVADSQSAPVPACNYAPQCKVLGPILILIFINDLPDVLSGNALLFSDDVKWKSARSHYEELHQNLQTAFQWSNDCDLP